MPSFGDALRQILGEEKNAKRDRYIIMRTFQNITYYFVDGMGIYSGGYLIGQKYLWATNRAKAQVFLNRAAPEEFIKDHKINDCEVLLKVHM